MADEISEAASLILRALVEQGKTTVRALSKKTGLKGQEVNRGIGWLVKEERIVIGRDGKQESILLRHTGGEGAVSGADDVKSEKEEGSQNSSEPK